MLGGSIVPWHKSTLHVWYKLHVMIYVTLLNPNLISVVSYKCVWVLVLRLFRFKWMIRNRTLIFWNTRISKVAVVNRFLFLKEIRNNYNNWLCTIRIKHYTNQHNRTFDLSLNKTKISYSNAGCMILKFHSAFQWCHPSLQL